MRKLILSAVILFGLAAPVLAQTALDQDITDTGINQGDLVILLQNIVNDVNNIKDDISDITTMLDSDGGVTFTSYTDKIDFESATNLTLSAP